MKHLLTTLLSLLLLSAFSQVDTTSSSLDALLKQSQAKAQEDKLSSQPEQIRTGLFISFGPGKDCVNHNALDTWTSSHFNTTINPSLIGFALNIGFIVPKYDGGLQWTGDGAFQVLDFYYGRSIIRTSWFRSFINLHLGHFLAGNFNNFAPLNYTLTPSQVGQNMVLQYGNFCLALSLKNIFFIKTENKKTFLLNSLDFKFCYMPFKGGWEYGYFANNSKYFNSNRVTGIPSFPSYFISISYCFGVIGN